MAKYCTIKELVDASGTTITTIFREYSNTLWSSHWHNGVDIAANVGSPIRAAADGTVVNTDGIAKQDGFGNRVVLKHDDGKATLYAHMSTVPPVKVGQKVTKGQVIGYVGGTGNTQYHYGYHLHFSMFDQWDKYPNIYYTGKPIDPIPRMGLGGIKFSSIANSTILDVDGKLKNLGTLSKYYSDAPTIVEQTASSSAPSTSTNTGSSNNTTSNSNELKYKVNDIVKFTGGSIYSGATASKAANTINKESNVKITVISKGSAHPYHAISQDGKGVYGWVDAKSLTDLTSASNNTTDNSSKTNYMVKVTTNVLNIRKGPGSTYELAGTIKINEVYTIVEESTGPGATKWGKLKSGAGWIALDYTKVYNP